jgi:hypothetical protein
MAQVTIRKVEEDWVAKAKALAVAKGVSMNSVLVDALKRGLEVEGACRRTNLDRFAADSPDEFGADWNESMKVFEAIDEEAFE